MVIYHQVAAGTVADLKAQGIKKGDRGTKGQDKAIIRTDKLLDAHRPERILRAGVSRCAAIYCYLGTETEVIDITDGSVVPVAKLKVKPGQALLRLTVDAPRCWVSDLDAFDSLKQAITKHQTEDQLLQLAQNYWQTLVRLDAYQAGSIRRPEVMITYDLKPQEFVVLN